MRCPHPPGPTRLLLAALLAALCTWGAPAALAAPKSAAPAASAAAPSKTKKTTPAKNAGKPATKTTSKKTTTKGRTGTKANTKAGSKAPGKTSSGGAGAGAAAGAAAAGAGGAVASPTAGGETEAPVSGVRLPLMLRVTPSLPDNPAALRSRLEGLVSAQGEGGQGAAVDSVSQLGPDIYAFSLRCVDAEQCQRVRMAIESQREWVAGLQLDERRHIPRAPDRQSPAAR